MAHRASAARRLGSARAGLAEWKLQRLTAVALVPLGLWFVFAMLGLSGEPYETVRAFFRSPFNATMTILTVIAAFQHARLGVRVIIEDYVHTPALRLVGLVATDLLAFAFATSSIVAVLFAALGS